MTVAVMDSSQIVSQLSV